MTNPLNPNNELNGYIVYVEKQAIEVYANTSFEAQTLALAKAVTRKKRPMVSVHLCELADKQVTTVITN